MSQSLIQQAKLVALPSSGLWRVTDWHKPFDPPPAPPALGTVGANEDNSGRWDAPDGSFKVLYCSTDPEGAIGEKIAPFTQNPAAVAQIEDFFEDDPEPEWDEDFLAAGLTADDVAGLKSTLSLARPRAGARALDVSHPRTLRVFGPAILRALVRWGVQAVDRGTLLSTERRVTRTAAGIYHRAACDGHDQPRWANGLRFESRLGPAWECWALWEPIPVEGDPDIEPLTIDNPHLRSAAAQLGVVLYDTLH